MDIYESRRGDFFISTSIDKLQIDVIHDYLSNVSYWAKDIPKHLVERSIENSISFGLYFQEQQIGFCRVVSDLTTFAYLADVFVLEEFRGQGLSKWLMEVVLAHPELQGLRRWMLATLDAHGLYEQYGFKALDFPERYMAIKIENPYTSSVE